MEYNVIKETGEITANRYLGGFIPSVPKKFIYSHVVNIEGYRLLWGFFDGEENYLVLIESTTFLASARPAKNQKKLTAWLDALSEKLNNINSTFDVVVRRAKEWLKPKVNNEERKAEETILINNIDLWVITSFM